MSAAAWPLYGHALAEGAFLEAAASGRLHHAWLLEGPSGIGKARLARRFAGYLLGAKGADGTGLDAGSDDPIVALMDAGGHPDLRWLSRAPDEKGKVPQDIKVDEIRALSRFFALRPAMGGWRIGVIDAVDELNRSGANALLKTLEEPPEKAVLFLIYHGEHPILPTIRSRCRRLRLEPIAEDETRAVLAMAGERDNDRLVRLAAGRPGRALRFATAHGSAALAAAEAILKAMPKPAAGQLSDAIARASVSDDAFDAFSGQLLDWAETKATHSPAFADTWLWLSRTLSEAREANMDRAQTTAKLVAGLQKAVAAS